VGKKNVNDRSRDRSVNLPVLQGGGGAVSCLGTQFKTFLIAAGGNLRIRRGKREARQECQKKNKILHLEGGTFQIFVGGGS